MVLIFEDCALDLPRRELRREGAIVPVEPKAFDIIALLIRERARVVTKQELVDAIWDGRFITDSSLSTAIKTARRALGDDGQTQHVIKTIHGQGFRFVADVQEFQPAPAQPVPEPRLE